MEKCTQEIVNAMCAITRNKSLTWEEKRKAADALKLETYLYVSDESKKARYSLMVACRNPADFGKDGKITESGLRLIRSLATNRPLNNNAFYAHAPNVDDTRIYVDGKPVRIEIKTGAGDWYRTECRDVESALQAYAQENKLLIWKTFAFTIVLPFSEFLDALDNYNEKGAAQFFKSSLKVNELGRVLQLQEWKTSKKKIRFLQQVARHSYNLKALFYEGKLVRRG